MRVYQFRHPGLGTRARKVREPNPLGQPLHAGWPSQATMAEMPSTLAHWESTAAMPPSVPLRA